CGERPQAEILVPLGAAARRVAGRVRADVDAAREQPLVLHRGEPPVVADDVADRIAHHVAIRGAIMSLQAERIGSSGRRGSDSALLVFLAVASAVTLGLLAGCRGRGGHRAPGGAHAPYLREHVDSLTSGCPGVAGRPP